MWNFKYKNQYLNYVSDLMQDTAVQSMRLLPQHRAGVSCYHHSVLVSYASWRVCDWLGLDARAAARGGLLHDFYLYNWRDAASHPGIRHGSQHPEVALRNARARFSSPGGRRTSSSPTCFPIPPPRCTAAWNRRW
ncbi:phosphohydrolase [Flavonifractor plautii]|nr:phosphohydrolase [Flavonifractor plautii]